MKGGCIMIKCAICGEEFTGEFAEDEGYFVNPGTPDEFWECSCCADMERGFNATQLNCDSCGALVQNRLVHDLFEDDGGSNGLCPCCNKPIFVE